MSPLNRLCHGCAARSWGVDSTRKGFTLIELLVVIGICTVVLAILMPAVTAARIQAKGIECCSNVRQICLALANYATNAGSYPPNVSTPAQWWYDNARVGSFFSKPTNSQANLVLVCPEDPGSVRSYAMNVWASAQVDTTVVPNTQGGKLWKPGSKQADKLILVTESWSSSGSAKFGWAAKATVGGLQGSPGQRFGGGTGLPPYPAGRWGYVNTELSYNRHRLPKGPGQNTEPIGRITIGYSDGHVEMKSQADLYFSSGLSRLDSLWSPEDPVLNN